MDAGVITASTALIGAVVTLLGALGAGIAFLINRADKKRESGEALMVEHFKQQLRNAEAKIRWLEEVNSIRYSDGAAWREQLIRSDIDPKPAEWTALPAPPKGDQ